jgi:SAM-dependent methyltransferase
MSADGAPTNAEDRAADPGFATDGRPVGAAEFAAINARHWDDLAEAHDRGTGRFYDTDALARGESPLWEVERLGLRRVAPDGVAGLDVLHLQCHLASDAIHFARQGARVVGLDASPVALERAAARAARCGVDLELVRADAADPPATLNGRFDLVWATIGVTGWAHDLDAWMAACARLLRPGGRLLLIDVHPLYGMFGTVDPPVADFPYGGGAVLAFDEGGSYDDPDAPVEATEAAVAAWDVGEHVSAAVRAGLTIEHLEEHDWTDRDPRGLLAPEEDGRHRLRLGPGQPPVPLLFTLVARR